MTYLVIGAIWLLASIASILAMVVLHPGAIGAGVIGYLFGWICSAAYHRASSLL